MLTVSVAFQFCVSRSSCVACRLWFMRLLTTTDSELGKDGLSSAGTVAWKEIKTDCQASCNRERQGLAFFPPPAGAEQSLPVLLPDAHHGSRCKLWCLTMRVDM